MADPTVFSFTMLDAQGIKATTRSYAQYNGAVVTMDSLIGAWSAQGGLLDAVTNAQIIGGSIKVPLQPNVAWKAAPVDENDVNDVITLDMGNSDNRYVWPFLVPAPLAAILVNGQVDLTHVGLAALFAELVAGEGTVTFSNQQGRDLDRLVRAFQSDRKRRRAVIAKSVAYP